MFTKPGVNRRIRSFFCLFCSLFAIGGPVMATNLQSTNLQAAIDELLQEADQALAENRLRFPVDDNALDRYQTVLWLDKGNQRALLGKRNIALRYLSMASHQLEQGRMQQARQLLASAVKVGGKTQETRQLRKRIQALADQRASDHQVQREPQRSEPKTLAPEQQSVFELEPGSLSRRHPMVMDQLARLGQRVQNTREYVMIFARSDAEGRWIYQQMSKASQGYRLRGNIKRHKKPRVVLEAPLD